VSNALNIGPALPQIRGDEYGGDLPRGSGVAMRCDYTTSWWGEQTPETRAMVAAMYKYGWNVTKDVAQVCQEWGLGW
jgi:hypothetical protein